MYLVFFSLYYLLNKQYTRAGLVYGLSVHFKIYPILYSFVFYLFIDSHRYKKENKNWTILQKLSKSDSFFTKNRIYFTLISGGTFFFLTTSFYYLYGYEFLYEAYLYHLVRKDNRHNFSLYWLLIY